MNHQLIAADNIRILCAAMVEKARSGHPGGAMGGADFINVLFSEFLIYDPANPLWEQRDRFFLDPGHMSPLLYAALMLCGRYSMEELQQFRQWGSPTHGHPELDQQRGIENASGPLGQGHAMAVGAAIAERFLAARFGEWTSHKIYTFVSDGGIQEEIAQGAGRTAGFLGLHNLIMFYDSNGIQLSTSVSAVTAENIAAKYEAWGWSVLTIDGNDATQIRSALATANAEKSRPTLIIGQTTMGKGIVKADGSSFENQCATHGMPISDAGGDIRKTIAGLGGNPDNPFVIFPETEQLYLQRRRELEQITAQKKAVQAQWERANPQLADKYRKFFNPLSFVDNIDFAKIECKPNIATRAASAAVLAQCALKIENMVVSSADLCNSDKTDGFLQHTRAFVKGDFGGNFLHAGVSELTMAAIMNGMALHGGVVPVCATFFVFSDYMKPAMRMSAQMGLPVKYVWTHDSFRVGEDGPTHHPVEQEAQARLLEQIKNRWGQNSLLVLRPADSAETIAAWQFALENISTPTALILTRQNVQDLPDLSGKNGISSNRMVEAQQLVRGAYILRKSEKPQLTLLANGSEVGLLMDAADMLERRRGISVQVVSAPSEGLFFLQTSAYRNSVIPPDMPVFGLTSGLPITLMRLAGRDGVVYGLDHFGSSAPYPVLEEKFGFTAENVYKEICKVLE
jgi:transketolase